MANTPPVSRSYSLAEMLAELARLLRKEHTGMNMGDDLRPGCPACDKIIAVEKMAVASEITPSEKKEAAEWLLLMLVVLKEYKDKRGKDAHYESHQPRAWELARAFLQRAMPKEYAESMKTLDLPEVDW